MTVRKTCPSLLIKKCGIRKHSKILLVLGLIVLVAGMYMTLGTARGAELTDFRDTLSDSRPSTAANHTLIFVTPTGVDASTDTITITFGTGTNLGTVAFGDMDLEIDTTAPIGDCGSFATSKTLAATPSTSPIWGAAKSGQVITFTAPTNAASGEIAAGSCVRIEIGTNATGGTNQITNDTAGTEDIDIAGAFGDTGSAKVIYIAGVTVSATVADTLSATVGLVNSGDCDTAMSDFSSATAAFVTTTATTVPFGAVTAENFTNGCQSLTIGTNASDGYTATIQETDQLTHTDATTQIADGVCDASCTDSAAAAWGTETINGFGYCMYDVAGNAALTTDASDDSGTGAVDWVDANQCDDTGTTPFFKTIPDVGGADTAEAVMRSFAAVSGDNSYVGFRLSVDTAQKGTGPSESYSNTIVYIVTPQYD